MSNKPSVEREPSDWEKKVSEFSEALSPIPGAAPPEEPQVDEVIPDEDEEEHDEDEDEDETGESSLLS